MPLSQIEKLSIEEIRKFRIERIAKIEAGEALIKLDDPGDGKKVPKMILHLVPEKAFNPSIIFSLSNLYRDHSGLAPVNSSAVTSHYNSEGFATCGLSVFKLRGSVGSYVQIFHNGIIEAVDLRLLNEGYIRGELFKKHIIIALPKFLSSQQKIGVEFPVFLMLSLLNIKEFDTDFVMPLDRQRIQQDFLLLPDLKIEKIECDIQEILKPLFDIVWNAAGQPDSEYKDDF
jgi:hypothetical protein